MPPRVCLIRHAQALHNVAGDDNIPDPVLTDLGIKQCERLENHLRQHWPLADKTQLIVTSPFSRCLQTTHLGLDWLIKQGVPVLARAEWQENANKPCDTGSPVSKIEKEYPDVNFTQIDNVYPSKSGRYAYTLAAIKQRGIDARKGLRSRPEEVIIVVTHSAFLRTAVAFKHFANADYRIFTFSEEPDSIELLEEELTDGKGGMGRSDFGWMKIEEHDFPAAEEVLEGKAPEGGQ